MLIIKKVLIIFGGKSTEHYISCKSCFSILSNIDKSLFDCKVVGIDLEGIWYEFNDDYSYLKKGNWKDAKITKIENIIDYIKKYDVVFPITHGNYGEDGKLQGFLELFDIKFVGCKTLSSAILMDKDISKKLFTSLNLKNVSYVTLYDKEKIENVIEKLKFPVIVKPANGGSSIGISKARTKQELIKAIEYAKKYDKKIIVEKYIKARELEVAVLEDKEIIISDIGEIKSANEIYDYNAKYENKDSYTKLAIDLPKQIITKIENYAKTIFKKTGISGYARIDFFYDGKDIYINEVNTIPGFTDISMYPTLIENKGISYKNMITKLIDNALDS